MSIIVPTDLPAETLRFVKDWLVRDTTPEIEVPLPAPPLTPADAMDPRPEPAMPRVRVLRTTVPLPGRPGSPAWRLDVAHTPAGEPLATHARVAQ